MRFAFMQSTLERGRSYRLKAFGEGQIGLVTQGSDDDPSTSMLALTMCLVKDGSPQSFKHFISMLRSLVSLNRIEDDEIINISVSGKELRELSESSQHDSTK